MCIIIYKKADATLKLSTLLRGYQRNDDGWGILAWTPNGMEIRRGFGGDADETLLDAFDDLRAYDMVIHCRIGTSGNLSIANTHPFQVADDLWLFHNGVIDIDRSADPNMCDSFHVARALADALGEHPSEALRDPQYLLELRDYAKTSKLVFADREGVVIVNEQLGLWEDGCWFSNDTAEKDAPRHLTSCGGFDDIGALDHEDRFLGDFYDGIVPRCFRVETQDDEDRLYLETLAFIDTLKKLDDVDEVAIRCAENPEMAAEALTLLVNSRHGVASL